MVQAEVALELVDTAQPYQLDALIRLEQRQHVEGQVLRVGVRRGDAVRPPLLLFNGIGANIELLEPFLDALDGPETIVFDVPGVGRIAIIKQPGGAVIGWMTPASR